MVISDIWNTFFEIWKSFGLSETIAPNIWNNELQFLSGNWNAYYAEANKTTKLNTNKSIRFQWDAEDTRNTRLKM